MFPDPTQEYDRHEDSARYEEQSRIIARMIPILEAALPIIHDQVNLDPRAPQSAAELGLLLKALRDREDDESDWYHPDAARIGDQLAAVMFWNDVPSDDGLIRFWRDSK
jgi:hypothetical protein